MAHNQQTLFSEIMLTVEFFRCKTWVWKKASFPMGSKDVETKHQGWLNVSFSHLPIYWIPAIWKTYTRTWGHDNEYDNIHHQELVSSMLK